MVLTKGRDIKINNLSLPLTYLPTGPVLAIQKGFLDPIAWVVNPAVTGEEPQILERVVRGEDVLMELRVAVRPTPEDDDLDELKAQWRELTGEDAGEDVYILGTGFTTHEVLLPRQTLLDIIQRLKKLRAEFPEPPFPWLFRLKPYYPIPTEGEKELVQKLEERAVAFKEPQEQTGQISAGCPLDEEEEGLLPDLEAAGIFNSAYSEKKEHWLQVWQCPTLLTYHKDAMRFLKHFRNHLRPPVAEGVPPELMLGASISIGSFPTYQALAYR
jgi:hypothetical protein